VDKDKMKPFHWCQGSTTTVDCCQFWPSVHFMNSKFVSLGVEGKIVGIMKLQVARSRGKDPDHWIQDVGEPSDLNLRGASHIVSLEDRPNPLVVRIPE
jgi:hypothetical protein